MRKLLLSVSAGILAVLSISCNGQQGHQQRRVEESKEPGIPKESSVTYQAPLNPVFTNIYRSIAQLPNDQDGFVKVLTDPKYGEILGVHIIGARAADLIAQAVVGLEYEVTASDMANISYAHPTYSEVLKEAYTIASGRPSVNI